MSEINMIFYRFWSELEKEFNEDGIKILLLTILASVYPLLAKLGYFFKAPLMIQVNSDRCIFPLAEILRGFNKLNLMPLSAQPLKIRKYLNDFNYGSILFSFGENRYTNENLMEIVSSCEKISEDISENSLKIVLSEKSIPQKYKDKFAGFLYVNNIPAIKENFHKYSLDFIRELISFSVSHVREIQYGNQNDLTYFDEDEQIINIVVKILRLYFKTLDMSQSEMEEWEKRINDGVKKIKDKWENIDDPEIYKDIFCKALYDMSGEFFDVIDRRNKVPSACIENIKNSLLYDKKYYYISNDFFIKICKSVNESEINYFKEQLANADIIVCEGRNRNYYTIKINVVTESNIEKYKMIKIIREKIDNEYGLSLKEEIKRRKEDENIDGYKIGQNGSWSTSNNITGI